MVKIKAPMMSLEASGSLGSALVFSTWKGKPYVRSLVKPANPRTAGQLGIRAMLSFISHKWLSLSLEDKITWAESAQAANISAFNFFIACNMRRWRQFKGPTFYFPADEQPTENAMTMVLEPGERNVLVTLTPTLQYTGSIIILRQRDEDIPTPNWNLAIAVVASDGEEVITFTDAPLSAATYYYRSACCNASGYISAFCATETATPT